MEQVKKMRKQERFLNFFRQRRDNYEYLFLLLDIRQRSMANR